MKNTWDLTSYSISTLEEYINNNTIIVPAYQRGIQWNDDKQKKLIETIKKGFPFGSILIYVDKNGKKQLIDGLQRCSTIFNFINQPSHFFNEADIDNDAIYEIIRMMDLANVSSVKEKIAEDIKSLLIKWVKDNHQTMQDVKQMQYYPFASLIAKNYPSIGDSYEKISKIVDVVKPMFKKYIEICDFILSTKIPVIELRGSDDDLPEIFERINSNGASLTKYQIYNATWSNVKIKITNEKLFEIINKVCARYDNMVEGYYEIDDYNSTKLNKDKLLNVFDLCFGFGKKLCNDYPYLFGMSKNPIKVESVGFSLINACLGNKVSEMNRLHKHLKDLGDDEKINLFLIKILECVKETDDLLRVVTTFKGNKRSIRNISINHTEMQIISIIAFMFVQKYVKINRNEFTEEIISKEYDFSKHSNTWHEKKDIFKSNCMIIYIMDCLNEKWRGSGDKKLNNIIQSSMYYFRVVNWQEFEKTLDLWNDMLINERREVLKVANPKESEKILLNIIYANIFKAADHLGNENYDIEHLATKNLMKVRLEKINKNREEIIKLPISAFGNLCYLIDADNRTKGKKTIYQDTGYLKGKNISEIEEKYSFTTKDDLEWIEIPDWDGDTFKKLYLEFINNRYLKLKQKIKDYLFG